MNERIKELIGWVDVSPKVRELAEKSGCSIDKLGYGEGNLEKFAELIVKDCLYCSTMVGMYNNIPVEPVQPAQAINMRIKKRFGVE